MFVSEYISRDYPTFSPEDPAEEAYEICRSFGFTHIFIEEEGYFAGALRQDFLEDFLESRLSDLRVHYEKFALPADAGVLESLPVFHTYNTSVVPIISREERYEGYVECRDVFAELSRYPLFSEAGAVLTLQTPAAHWSMSEISQIVEGSNGRIHGVFISRINTDSIEITLKISSGGLSSIEETFERYGYIIINKHYQNERDELMRQRFDFLQKYIEV